MSAQSQRACIVAANTPPSNSHYPPHSHSGETTHLVLKGSLTAVYPDDPQAEKKTYSIGETWLVPAKKKHEVWVGPEGCTYVIGE